MSSSDDSYYLIVFGSQRHPNWPRFSHTFAAVVHAGRDKPDRDRLEMESKAIGWLPETMKIHWWSKVPEPGKNFSLAETLEWVFQRYERVPSKVHAWGPYQIKQTLYDRFVKRVAQLESGSVKYLAVDNRKLRPDRACNCIHALSDLGLTQVLLGTGPAHGHKASLLVTRYFEELGLILDPETVYPLIRKYLDLEKYPIVYKQLN